MFESFCLGANMKRKYILLPVASCIGIWLEQGW